MIGGESAFDTLLAATSDRRFNVRTAALDSLTAAGIKKVAPRIASELLSYVHEPVGDLSLRTPIAGWGDTLVKFGYTDPIDDLAAAASIQPDPDIKASLESCVRRLQLLVKNKDDVAAWAAAYASPLPDVRHLADVRLAEIGSPPAVRAIAIRLAASDLASDERARVLLAIAEARTTGAAELIERHLSDPAFDTFNERDVRSAAAYAALRIGGDRMARALKASAVRRDGQDWATLAYLAELEKGASLQTLRTLRVRRLRYPDSTFGHQEWLIDEIIGDVAAGRKPLGYDVPPEELSEK
jgi:HEAT repeat protein